MKNDVVSVIKRQNSFGGLLESFYPRATFGKVLHGFLRGFLHGFYMVFYMIFYMIYRGLSMTCFWRFAREYLPSSYI